MDQLMLGVSSPYDGLADPEAFIRSFSLKAFLSNWTAEQQCEVIPLMLEGKAARVYNAMSNDNKKVIKTVLDELKKQCSKSNESALAAFYESRPIMGESWSKFASVLQRLLDKTGLNDEAKQALIKAQLCSYLPEELKVMANFNKGMKWEDLLVALDESSSSSQADSSLSSSSYWNKHKQMKSESLEANATMY